ncbi:hypothetical protein C7S13_5143 [Burkholderia cepacia]|nr:hypothetical protein [Burkholderia cepacia]MDW9247276.1 hypothetical protein [Burkholderia cepacia]
MTQCAIDRIQWRVSLFASIVTPFLTNTSPHDRANSPFSGYRRDDARPPPYEDAP